MEESRECEKGMSFQRGAVIVWVVVAFTTLLGFAALAVDLGYVRTVRSELQNTADAAALAGVSALATQTFSSPPGADLIAAAQDRATRYAVKNRVAGSQFQIATTDITVGNLQDPNNLNEGLSTSVNAKYPFYTAIRVTARKTADSPCGPVGLFFASIWGRTTTSTTATAVAYLDGHGVGATGGILIPVTVRSTVWESQIVQKQGADTYGYDEDQGQVTAGSDGTPEISIYTSELGNGSFGLLHFGAQKGTSALQPQIQDGLTAQDFQDTPAVGDTKMVFYQNNQPRSYQIQTKTGVNDTLAAGLEGRVGKVVGFFIHSDSAGTGSNRLYKVVGIQYVRVLYADMHGDKVVVAQPTSYTGDEVITDDTATDNLTAGRIRLVR